MLNQIINEYKGEIIAITSIGLDGEKIDNVTSRPKPRIRVYPKTIIATAYDCLKECYFDFVIHEKTNVRTPLGEIVIIEAITEGLALVAGPSTLQEMKQVLMRIENYNVTKILIDGALFRKSIASFNIADAAILSTGASYSKNIDTVVNDTVLLLEELMLDKVDKNIIDLLSSKTQSLIIDKDLNITLLNLNTILSNEEVARKYLDIDSRYLYLSGALSNRLVQVIIDKRFEIKDLTIVVKDATHIIVDTKYLEKLKITKTKLKVINKITVLLLTYNPHSSLGYEFDNEEFKNKLHEKIDLPIINVLKDLE